MTEPGSAATTLTSAEEPVASAADDTSPSYWDVAGPQTNPHSYPLQCLAVGLCALLFSLLYGFPGLLIIATGLLVFLDAWNAGIYKDKTRRAFLNLSPAAWGIVVMGFFLVGFFCYELYRDKMKTRPGSKTTWVLSILFGWLAVAQLSLGLILGVVSLGT